jgi:hypothetical protein
MSDIHDKLRVVQGKAAELVRLADSIDAGVYLAPQKAAVEGMQNMLRRWQRWELRESLIAFGLAECHLPCPQKGINEVLEEKVNAGNKKI